MNEIDRTMTEAVGRGLSALFGLGFIMWLITLALGLGFVVLIVLVIKKVWYWNPEKKKKQNPPTIHTRIEFNEKQKYNKQENKPKTKESTKNKREPNWYPSGWVFNEETQLWDPPEYLQKEARHRWEWNQEKGIWIDKEKEARLERYRKYHEGREPTYEEWRAAQQKKKDPEEHTNIEGESTYRIRFIQIPKQEPKETIYQEPLRTALKEPIREEKPKTGYEDAYEVTPLLTYNESRNFRSLQEAAFRKGYMICPKVRLADIVKPRNDKKYMSNFGKIKSKHVDFTICDQNMKVLAVVELDDSSHDRPDRQERDEFVDSILEANGIKVIHTRHITPDILDNV